MASADAGVGQVAADVVAPGRAVPASGDRGRSSVERLIRAGGQHEVGREVDVPAEARRR